MIDVYTTVPDQETATSIAEALVNAGLAACVNMHEVSSVYMWNDELVTDDEVALHIKTSLGFEVIGDEIDELHPYDVPLIMEHCLENVNEEYGEWVRGITDQ